MRRLPALLAGGLTLAFVALLAYGLLTSATSTSIDDGLARNETVVAPDIAPLEVLRMGDAPPGTAWRRAAADGRVDLTELRGTPVVLNYWASWCVPCRTEAPVLERGSREARGRGVLFVGLNMQDIRDDARSFLDEFGVTFPQIRDPNNAAARAWGVTGLPETFFISRTGRVVGHVIGTVSATRLEEGVRTALTGRPTPVRQGGERRPTR